MSYRTLAQIEENRRKREHELSEFHETLLECENILDITNEMWKDIESDVGKMKVFSRWNTVRYSEGGKVR